MDQFIRGYARAAEPDCERNGLEYLLGLADVVIIDRGNQPGTVGVLLEAFTCVFAIRFLAATVSHGIHPIVTGALVGSSSVFPTLLASEPTWACLEPACFSAQPQDGSQTPGT